jgi:ferredoxin
MKINQEKCTGCQECVRYCPVNAIEMLGEKADINQDLCVECTVCLKSGACNFEAIYRPSLEWPRILRSNFSDRSTGHDSGGTGQRVCKTNDVTGRLVHGELVYTIELGRPGISTSFADAEKVAMALAGKVKLDPALPVMALLDHNTGIIKDPNVRKERALSIVLQFKTAEDEGVEMLNLLKRVSEEIDTVFSLGVTIRCTGYEIPFKKRMDEAGFNVRPNGKVNVGLGRPLA